MDQFISDDLLWIVGFLIFIIILVIISHNCCPCCRESRYQLLTNDENDKQDFAGNISSSRRCSRIYHRWFLKNQNYYSLPPKKNSFKPEQNKPIKFIVVSIRWNLFIYNWMSIFINTIILYVRIMSGGDEKFNLNINNKIT